MGKRPGIALIPHVNIEITPKSHLAPLLKRALLLTLGRDRGEVSVRLLSARPMRALNKASLGHDYATDVLSFDHGQTPEGRLLEIVVCPEVAKREAKARGIAPEQELTRYVVHGALHLLGHDDHEPGAKQKMWRAQERVMKKLFGSGYDTDEISPHRAEPRAD